VPEQLVLALILLDARPCGLLHLDVNTIVAHVEGDSDSL
jgi:hypothetical protein